MERCLLDLDGVIVDFVGAAAKAHDIPHPYFDNPEALGNFWFNEILGMSKEEFWKPLNNFEFWCELDFMPDAPEILDIVERYFGPKNVCILTSPSEHHMCSAGKQWWIQKYLPGYKRRFFIGAAKQFFVGTKNILIDDFNDNVDIYRKEGGIAILVPRLWNRYHQLDPIEELVTRLEALK